MHMHYKQVLQFKPGKGVLHLLIMQVRQTLCNIQQNLQPEAVPTQPAATMPNVRTTLQKPV